MTTFKTLELRLKNFALSINQISKELKQNYISDYLIKQMIRSSISSYLNYGEAQFAESKRDFVHKMRISLKELKETSLSLEMIKTYNPDNANKIENISKENMELIAIFYSSIKTASKKYN